jgi:hypothetical protein
MECIEKLLSVFANAAAIITAFVAVWAWCRFKRDISRKKETLESYLKKSGKAHTAIMISRETKLSEAEIWQVSSNNDRIKLLAKANKETGMAEEILFQYNDGNSNQ